MRELRERERGADHQEQKRGTKRMKREKERERERRSINPCACMFMRMKTTMQRENDEREIYTESINQSRHLSLSLMDMMRQGKLPTEAEWTKHTQRTTVDRRDDRRE